MSNIDRFLASLEKEYGSQAKGKPFEIFCKWFLENDPVWSTIVDRVWLWEDYPKKWQRQELGTDLVFEDSAGATWAVQAKCYNEQYSTTKSDVNSFLADSGRAQVQRRLWIQTTNKMATTAQKALQGQEKPVTIISLDDFRNANLVFPESFASLAPLEKKEKLKPKPHQKRAIQDVLAHFKDHNRGQLIMACGTGKTFTTLWIKEGLSAKRTLVLVPSLNLLSQSMREWARASKTSIKTLAVCSDKSVGREDEDISSQEVAFPVTSEVADISNFLKSNEEGVVFCTYHSSELIAKAQLENKTPTFDLAIADEAHRCAGNASADFAIILDEKRIRSSKRLFTTATPRYFAENSKRSARSRGNDLVSMNDEDAFGPEFHKLTFGKAISKRLLNDYRVVVFGVNQDRIKELIEERGLVTLDKKIADAETLAAQLGLLKAIRDYDLERVISFHSRKSRAKEFSNQLDNRLALIKKSQRPTGIFFSDCVTGDMRTSDRREKIRQLERLDNFDRGILTNARCLAEGVNVPVLDGIAFIDPKASQIDIIQAVGRAIRRVRGAQKQKLGTIVVPVFLGEGETADEALANSKFEPIWWVLKALRAHDEVLAELLDNYRLSLGKREKGAPDFGGKVIFDLPSKLPRGFADALRTEIVEKTTESWEYWFGLLTQFIEDQGHARVEAKYETKDKKKLGVWCDTQRLHFRNDLLRADRVERISSLENKGWVWSLKDTQRAENIRRIEVFFRREGHSMVPDGHKEPDDDFALGNAVRAIKHAYKEGTLEEKWIEKLEKELYFIWDIDRFYWIQDYKLLRNWCRQNKKPAPPKGTKLSVKIGPNKTIDRNIELFRNRCLSSYSYWVKGERGARKTAPRRLSEQEIAALERIPFWVWNAREARHRETLVILDDYLRTNNVADITQTTIHNDFPLGARLSKMRGRKNTMPDFVLSHLSASGYQLDPFEAKWQEMFSLLEAYVRKHKTAYVGQSVYFKGKALGAWVSTQRTNYKAGKLEEKKVEVLEGMKGWLWDASHRSASGLSKTNIKPKSKRRSK